MLGLFFRNGSGRYDRISFKCTLNLGIRGPSSETHSGYKHPMAGPDQVFRSSCFIGRMNPATASALSYPRHFAISQR
jgi:hypothetical protein